MDPQIIRKRIKAIDNSTASIVGIGAWCALHAGDAAAIVGAICDRIAAPPSHVVNNEAKKETTTRNAPPSTSGPATMVQDETEEAAHHEEGNARKTAAENLLTLAPEPSSSSSLDILSTPCDNHKAACLYVLHEVVLSCAMGAVSEAVRRQALSVSIAARLPAAIRHAVTIGEATITAALAEHNSHSSSAAATTTATTASTKRDESSLSMFSLISRANVRREMPSLHISGGKGPGATNEGKAVLPFVDDFSDFLDAVLKVTSWWNTPPLDVLFPNKDKLKEMRAPVIAFNKKYGLHVSSSSNPLLGVSPNHSGAAQPQQQQQQLALTSPLTSSSSSATTGGVVGGIDINNNLPATTSSAPVVPRQLSAVLRLLSNYEAAKERFDKLSNSLLGNTVSGGVSLVEAISALTPQQREELDSVRDEASRRLIFAIKALDGRGAEGFIPPPPPSTSTAGGDGSDKGLLAKLHDDLIELQNSAAIAPPAPIDEKDDLLGSFF